MSKYIISKDPSSDFLGELSTKHGLDTFPKEGKLLFNQDSWQRWGKKNLPYRWKGTQTIYNGNLFSFGTFIDMRSQETKVTLKSWETDNRPLTPKDWKVLNKTIRKDNKESVKTFFNEIIKGLNDIQNNEHPYLKKKQLTASNGIKINEFNEICIPMFDVKDDHNITGIQKITAEGKKLNYPNSKLGIFPIGETTKRIFICEGISDALTIHEFTSCQTICCFGLNNMEKVAILLAKENEKIQYIICADKITPEQVSKRELKSHLDYEKIYGTKFEKQMNILVIFPRERKIEAGSYIKDFNDLYLSDPDYCEQQLNNLGDVPYIKLLGYKGNQIYLFSSVNSDVHTLKEGTKSGLYLVADKSYWRKKFPGCKDEKVIITKLFSASQFIKYDSWKLRGSGVYQDKGNLVINTGSHIIGKRSKDYSYLMKGKFPDPLSVDGFPRDYWNILATEVFPYFSFENKWDVYILFSFLIMSVASRILPFRFSLDLQSESSTGKSYILDDIMIPFYSKLGDGTFLKVNVLDSLAATRESLANHSIVGFEENESKSDDSKSLATMFNDIIRQISTSPALVKRKASPRSGDYFIDEIGCNVLKAYNVGGSVITADLNRTVMLTLSRTKQWQSDFRKVMHLLDKNLLANLGLGLCCTFINKYEDFLKLYKEFVGKEDIKEWNSFHKFKIYMQIFSTLKTLELISPSEQDEFVAYTKEKEELVAPVGESEIVLESILNFSVWIGGRSHTIRNIIESYVSKKSEDFEEDNYRKMTEITGVSLGRVKSIPVLRVENASSYLKDMFYKTNNKRYMHNYNHALVSLGERTKFKLPSMPFAKRGVVISTLKVFNITLHKQIDKIIPR